MFTRSVQQQYKSINVHFLALRKTNVSVHKKHWYQVNIETVCIEGEPQCTASSHSTGNEEAEIMQGSAQAADAERRSKSTARQLRGVLPVMGRHSVDAFNGIVIVIVFIPFIELLQYHVDKTSIIIPII